MSDAPSDSRNLPEVFYGGFDVRQMPDGSKRYRLPHTLYGTVMAIVMSVQGIIVIAVITAVAVMTLGVPVEPVWFGSAIAFLGFHAMSMLLVLLWALITGYRCATYIAIRPDGLVWNDRKFFAAAHIWVIGYGTTSNTGRPDEEFEPLIEIQLGTRRIVLAEDLDPVAGKMFMRLFEDDTRRYWHGHN